MKKILCFGELLLRLSPDLNGEWLSKSSLHSFLGGAELNVANALACWNQPVAYCSVIPDHWLSSEILQFLGQRNIDISPVLKGGNRLGTYYLPDGADLKHAGVIYDRALSAFSELRTGQLNWEKLLADIDWFHFSAITPALNQELAMVCEEGLKLASAQGIYISLDLNYRSKLWQFGKEPVEVMPALAEYCDLIMGNIWSAEKLLGIPIDKQLIDQNNRESYEQHALGTAKEMEKRFPRATTIANTFRFEKGDEIEYYGTIYAGAKQFISSVYTIRNPMDRVGTGDCFMAGLIYGLRNLGEARETIEFATAAASGKFFEKGDFTSQSVEKINRSMQTGPAL